MNNLFIAAGMRTGSTHIANCFQRLGLRRGGVSLFAEENAYNEEEYIHPDIAGIVLPLGGWVIQHHMRAVGRNAKILAQYGIKPVVTTRNIFRAVESWVDSQDRNVDSGKGRQFTFSPIHIPDWHEWHIDEKYDWAVYNVVPWYLSFYVSWLEAETPVLTMRYEDFFADQAAGIKRIAAWVGLPKPQGLDSIIEHRDGHFNPNNHRSHLGARHVKRIEEQIESWGPQWAEKLRRVYVEE